MQSLLLLPLLVLFGCSGKYPSAAEALAACNDWKAEGGSFRAELEPGDWITLSVRRCKQDPAGLYLGVVNGEVKAGAKFTFTQGHLWSSHVQPARIIKRFRY